MYLVKIIMRLVEYEITKKLLGITIFLLSATPIISYILWILDGCDPIFPYISDLDLQPSAGLIFTLGYSICGVLLSINGFQIAAMRGIWMENNNLERKWIIINRLSIIPSIVSGICLSWIAFTPWDEDLRLHLIQANFIFFGSIAWAIITIIITFRISEENRDFATLINKRVSYTTLSIIGLIGMIERVYKYLQISPEYLDIDSRTGFISGSCVALDEKLLTQSAVFEWMYVVGTILLISTFFGEIKILSFGTKD